MKSLRDLVKDLGAERDVRKITLDQYDRSARYYSDFIGREAMPADLDESRVNLWVTSLQERDPHLEPLTIKNYLRGMLVLWSYASSLYLVNEYQRSRIKKPKVPRKTVKAWDGTQVAAIIEASSVLTGNLKNGCPIATYMKAYSLAAADTMFRPGDMRRLEWGMICGHEIRIIQSKTQVEVVRPLRSATVAALEELRKVGKKPRIFWLTCAGQRRHETKVRKAAGVWESQRALGKLRHAGATKTARDHGMAAATASLGHLPGSTVAATSYVAPERSAVPGPWQDAS